MGFRGVGFRAFSVQSLGLSVFGRLQVCSCQGPCVRNIMKYIPSFPSMPMAGIEAESANSACYILSASISQELEVSAKKQRQGCIDKRFCTQAQCVQVQTSLCKPFPGRCTQECRDTGTCTWYLLQALKRKASSHLRFGSLKGFRLRFMAWGFLRGLGFL